MLQNQPKKPDRNLSSLTQDLQLIKYQTIQSSEETIPVRCKNVSELSKILAIKNRQPYFKQIKLKKREFSQTESLLDDSKYDNLQRMSILVQEEKERVLREIKLKTIGSQKPKQTVTINILKTLQQPDQKNSSKIPVFEFLEMLGGQPEIEVCRQYRISNQYNKEAVEDLAQCFKHIINLSEPIKSPQKKVKKIHFTGNISQYKSIFHQIVKIRSSDQDKIMNLMTYFDDLQKNSSFQKLFGKNILFKFCLNMLKQHSSISQSNTKRQILTEGQRVFKTIEIFNQSQQKQRKFMSQSLNPQQFWEKVCYLYSKGPQFQYLLQHHLKYANQNELLMHFQRISQGLQSKYNPNESLLESSKHYTEFIMLLECKYLRYCIENENKQENQLIYYALRESALLYSQGKPNVYQTKFLKQASSKILYQFKTNLSLKKEDQLIKQQIIQLFALGEYSGCISLLHQHQRINLVETIILLSILHNFDLNHSYILLYDHIKTVLIYKQLIQSTIEATSSFQMQEYYLILASFLPSFNIEDKENKNFAIEMITHSKKLFEYLAEHIGFEYFMRKLNLTIHNIPEILQASMKKHRNYAYCLQLGLSSCFQLTLFPKLMPNSTSNRRRTSQDTGQYTRSSIVLYNVGKRFNQFEDLTLNIMKDATPEFINQKQARFKILMMCFESLIKENLNMMKDSKIRQIKYEEIAYINGVYKKLSQIEIRKVIYSNMEIKDHDTIKDWSQKILIKTNILFLTFNMIKIKTSIKNRQFEYIVDVLNSIFEEIATPFKETIIQLEKMFQNSQPIKKALFNFIGDIIQSIQFLKTGKTKVIHRNRKILYYVCKQVHSFLQQIQGKCPQAKLLFHDLEKIMSQLNCF